MLHVSVMVGLQQRFFSARLGLLTRQLPGHSQVRLEAICSLVPSCRLADDKSNSLPTVGVADAHLHQPSYSARQGVLQGAKWHMLTLTAPKKGPSIML